MFELLEPILAEQRAAMYAGDYERFMRTFDPDSPFIGTIETVWSYYLQELKVLATSWEPIRVEELGPGEKRFWLYHYLVFEGYAPQRDRCYYDLVQVASGQWLCRLFNRFFPTFGEGHEPPVNLEPLSPPETPLISPVREIGPELGGPEAFVQTIMRRYKFIRSRPVISSALIMANMMSEATARLTVATYHRDISERMRRIAAYWQKFAVHIHATERAHPWPTGLYGFLRGPKQGADEMLHFGGQQLIIGLCDGLQAYMTAMLRLGGIPSDRVWEVSLLTGGTTHSVTLVDLAIGPFMISNNVVTSVAGIPYHHRGVISFANDRLYWSVNAGGNLTPQEMKQAVVLHSCISPSFDLAKKANLRDDAPSAEPEPEPEPELGVAYTIGESSAQLAARVRVAVAQRAISSLSPVFTHAWYAYQSVQVRWPEAYFLASIRAPQAIEAAAQVADVPALLAWIKANLAKGSIFTEPDRIMTAEQVLVHGTGDPWSLALLAASILAIKGWESYCVLTDTSGHLAYRTEGTFCHVDMATLEPSDKPTATVQLVFNGQAAYHPAAGRVAPVYDGP